MADVFLGSLMLVPYNFPPKGYAFCQGQVLSIAANTALFSLLGVTYGGNGTTNFGLPDLRGRLAVGQGQASGGSNYVIGQSSGTETVTLATTHTPPHQHGIMGTAAPAAQTNSANDGLARTSPASSIYSATTAPLGAMNPNLVIPVGSGRPHTNMMPYTTLNWIIALTGIYPPRS
jgi:microcystin-dependent protein